MNPRTILIKALTLQKYFDAYKNADQRNFVLEKFVVVWGNDLAQHFLFKYNDAENLIQNLDSDNLDLFINKF